MIRGWRAYALVTNVPGKPRLVKGMWRPWPTTEMTAECLLWNIPWPLYNGSPPEPPGLDVADRQALCRAHIADLGDTEHAVTGCGIYVVPNLEDLDGVTNSYGQIQAAVIGWGLTATYEAKVKDAEPVESYRVERARIEYMRLRPPMSETDNAAEIVAGLSEYYGVVVELAS